MLRYRSLVTRPWEIAYFVSATRHRPGRCEDCNSYEQKEVELKVLE